MKDERLQAAGIPRRFWAKTLKTYRAETQPQCDALTWAWEFANSCGEMPRGAVLIGATGTGKTHLACGVAQQVMETMAPLYSQHSGTYYERVRYMTVQGVTRSVKESWSGGKKAESEARARLTGPRLLVLDEIGVQYGSDFEAQLLFDVINDRYENMKPTILVSNLGLAEVSELVGDRVIDRLREDGGSVLVFDWESERGKPPAEVVA